MEGKQFLFKAEVDGQCPEPDVEKVPVTPETPGIGTPIVPGNSGIPFPTSGQMEEWDKQKDGWKPPVGRD